MDKRKIRDVYDDLAPWYDVLEGVPDLLLGSRRLRREIVGEAAGRVLEVAVGTGKNLPHYPRGCRVFGIDLSPGMLARARRRERAGPLARMDVEALAFPDGCFDTVVDSMALCTFPEPVTALREMTRVCRRDGRVLLVEHGRSDHPAVGRFQDRHVHWLSDRVGCHWNREPDELVEAAGLEVVRVHRTFLGIFQGIVAQPPARTVSRRPARRPCRPRTRRGR